MVEILEQALADHVSPDAAGFVAAVFSLSDGSELQALPARAGFEEISVVTRTRRLPLPPPEEFLCCSICRARRSRRRSGASTKARAAFVRDVVGRWEPFAGDDGAMVMQLEVPLATAR